MRVVYSVNVKFGGHGVGYTAYNAVVGIYHAGWLQQLFASSNAQILVPPSLIRQWGMIGRAVKYSAAKDPTGLIAYLEGLLFDVWVAAQFPLANLFHGWNGLCLCSIRRAKSRGITTVVERASLHPATQFQLLREEYTRWNVPLRLPSWNYARSLSEIDAADYITIPSTFVRQSMTAAGVPEQKLLEIPFGVDPSRFFPAEDVPTHPFRAIFAGNVCVSKGVPDLLEAWRRLAWRDAELWIIGAVLHDFAMIRARWSDLPEVHFIPHSKELTRLFQQGDVFVFPSIQEGSALVTYEAMACGLPVITTPNAGSVVRDGEDGFVVPIRDVDALCDRLERLRGDAALRTQMERAARERVSNFTWDSYRARLIEAYQRISR